MTSIRLKKEFRKWRDRLFHLRENALDRLLVSGPRRVLFPPWPEIEWNVKFGFQRFRHELRFGEIPPGGGDFDVVVPVSIPALQAAQADEVLRRRNPLPLPSAAAIELCDNKAALQERLSTAGFGRYLPADVSKGSYPYMLKKNRDSCAANAHRMARPGDEEKHAAIVDSPDYLRQEWIAGEVEFTAHLLHYGGRVRRALTLSFLMAEGGAIRGRDPVRLHRRCRARHVALFEAMLNAAGFEGLCCVNYKERAGVPVVLEINPRFGFSLAPYFSAFMRSLDWGRGS